MYILAIQYHQNWLSWLAVVFAGGKTTFEAIYQRCACVCVRVELQYAIYEQRAFVVQGCWWQNYAWKVILDEAIPFKLEMAAMVL